VVLCVNEKPQIQALTGTASVLPMRPGQPERRTHDNPPQPTTPAAPIHFSGDVPGGASP
jgi:hypothetical protein